MPRKPLVIALWILHTYVFDRFSITPRLTLLSPVRGCGKTLLLLLIEMLVGEPIRTDEVTAAAIYHQLDYQPRSVLLIDEGDNLGLLNNRTLRAVFNSGHRRGGGGQPICRWMDAQISNLCSAGHRGDRYVATTAAASFDCHQHAARAQASTDRAPR